LRALLAAAVFLLAPTGGALAADRSAPPLVPRDLSPLAEESHSLLQLAPGAISAAAAGLLRRNGGELVSARLRIWRLPSPAARRLVPRLALAAAIRDAEPDHARRVVDHLTAGDPLLPSQWWIGRIGADRAEPPGAGVPVTVIDSGVDLSHAEFAGRPDTFPLNSQTVQGRSDFHGTSVASVAAAPANGVGVVGVYPRAALRLWDASPSGSLSASAVIRGIDAAAAAGPGIINLSLGGTARSRLEEQAVLRAFQEGSVLVAASGNDREQHLRPSFPASLPHVLTVGAIDPDDRLASFSSPSAGMDVVAPGVAIPIAVPLATSPSGFIVESGTSFATPIVAGAAAWVWTQRRDLEKTQLHELMRRSAVALQPGGRNADTGFGVLDIPRALTLAAPPIDPQEPNDQLEHVIPGRFFAAGKPPVTRPGSGRTLVNARLDGVDDPSDVYRVWAPAGGRVVVTLSGPATVRLRYSGPSTIRGTSRVGPRRLELVNRLRQGRFVYVTAFVAPATSRASAAYRLGITTGRAPAPARR
jgi:hypothetical protein